MSVFPYISLFIFFAQCVVPLFFSSHPVKVYVKQVCDGKTLSSNYIIRTVLTLFRRRWARRFAGMLFVVIAVFPFLNMNERLKQIQILTLWMNTIYQNNILAHPFYNQTFDINSLKCSGLNVLIATANHVTWLFRSKGRQNFIRWQRKWNIGTFYTGYI